MTARSDANVLLAASAGLWVSSWWAGTPAAWLLVPLAAVLTALGFEARSGVPARRPPQWLVVGVLALGGAGLAAWTSSALAGLLALGSGAWVIDRATRASAETGNSEPVSGRVDATPAGFATRAAIAADSGLLASWQIQQRLSGGPLAHEVVDDVRAAAARYRAEDLAADPARAFPLPPALEKVHVARRTVPILGAVEELSFESEFEPIDPEIREAYLDLAPNRIAQATCLRHPDGPRPTLLCVHGLAGGVPSLDARLFASQRLHALGLDVVQVTLPFHGRRTVGRLPGQGFLDGHPLMTNAAFGQAVWELRRLAGWARGQGAPAVGVLGVSLGAYTAALFASVERGLATVVPMIPAVRLAELVRRDTSPARRRELDTVGFDDALLAEVFTPHAILGHQPRVAPEGRLIVGGLADRICPPSHAEALWAHWGEPGMHWYPGSHLVRHGDDALRARIDAHLEASLLAAAKPLPLTRFR